MSWCQLAAAHRLHRCGRACRKTPRGHPRQSTHLLEAAFPWKHKTEVTENNNPLCWSYQGSLGWKEPWGVAGAYPGSSLWAHSTQWLRTKERGVARQTLSRTVRQEQQVFLPWFLSSGAHGALGSGVCSAFFLCFCRFIFLYMLFILLLLLLNTLCNSSHKVWSPGRSLMEGMVMCESMNT